ncbi:CxxxxCH/CxxCH domain-containing protein [Geobacter sp. DSM 9736]|uniref:CxxxxCH/CxxCH domain c-type cytochrome n=1 Tax=Geobacter sp. DSM 9736 TaxID=1277350 RepID=UPI000B50AE06|nr:CxxxxCH/CxxCH domain-containing protein [Geobacter sp. DSM 9736]SNB47391.1 Geobacter sulfurreducens CxxxxCH...CXXCH domain-containing protein [Geobacter sp. DSM 9736]
MTAPEDIVEQQPRRSRHGMTSFFSKTRAALAAAFLVPGMLFFSPLAAHAAAQQYQHANACYDCHGTASTDPGNPPDDVRPLDSAYRNLTTGGFKGSHRTHISPTTDPDTCEKCHGDLSAYTTAHMDEKIDLAANINASPGGATYSRGVQFNWTSNQSSLGKCSNVNCHFQALTPNWGTAPFTYTDNTTNDCDQCHGAPPSGGGSGAAGSHARHQAYYPGAAQCKKCHFNHLAGAAKFAHATSAGKAGRVILVDLHDPADVAGGTYSGTGENFLPSQSPVFGDCSSSYCHSDGKGNYVTPTWGSAATGACGTCHGARNDSPPSPASPHATHVATASGYKFACVKCHSGTVETTPDSTTYANISSYTLHVNKVKDVLFDPLNPAGSWNGANCASTYCHSNAAPYLGSNTPVTQGWSGALDCDGCHNKAGDTIAGAKAWSAPHTKHVNTYGTNGNITCNACHAQTASDNDTISGPAKHVDGIKTVAWNAFANNAAPAYNLSTHQCRNVYCHGNGTTATPTVTVTWSGTLDCNGCHGSNASTPPASAPHAKHVGSSSPYRFACARCHSTTALDTTDSTTFANISSRALHVNKEKDLSFDSYNAGAGWSSPNCSTLYCHSIGDLAIDPGTLPGGYGGSLYASPTWSGTLGCNACHGRSTAGGSPDYPNAGAPGSATSNSHPKHVVTSSISCGECHEKTTKQGTSIRSTTPSFHVDKSRNDIFFNLSGNSKDAAYDTGARRCSATYCHGTGASPAWGGTTNCDSCHSANNSGPWNTSTAHKLHWEDGAILPAAYSDTTVGNVGTAVSYRFTCASCHLPGSGLAVHVSGPAHANGRAQIQFGYTSPGKKPVYTYGGTTSTSDNGFMWSNGSAACTATYCHSNGAGGNGATAVNWAATTRNADPAGRCASCHPYSAIATGKHGRHVGSYGFSCGKCHQGTTNDGSSIADKRIHADKVKDVSFDGDNPGAGWSTPNCSTVYCHSLGDPAIDPGTLPGAYGGSLYASPAWSGTLACNACHGRSTASGVPDYPNSGAPGSVTSNSHSKHVVSSAISCGECHEKTTKQGTSIRSTPSFHVNNTRNDIFFNLSGNSKDAVYDSGARTCSATYCHGTAASPAWGGTTACDSCHSAGNTGPWNASTAHKLHWEDATLAATYSDSTTGNIGTAASYRFACASCHLPGAGLAVHLNGPAHANGAAQVFFGYTSPGKKPVYSYGVAPSTSDNGFEWSNGSAVCTATYCHSNGNGGNGATAVNWATAARTADPAVRCASCHPYTAIATGKHGIHAGTYGYSCGKCHQSTTNDGSSIADKRLHINKTKNIVWDATNSDGNAYVNAGTNCSNIYCHSNGTAMSQPYPAPATGVNWGSGALACNSCHGQTTYSDYRKAAPLYASGSPKGNAHQFHIAVTASPAGEIQCRHCHNETTTANTSIEDKTKHVDKTYDVSGGTSTYKSGDDVAFAEYTTTINFSTAGGTGSCANVSCHPVGLGKTQATTSVKWNNSYQCIDCHDIDMQSTTGYHHAMRNFSSAQTAAYPTGIPSGSSDNGTNYNSRRCTMCHVDHNIFSPFLNGNNNVGRAANLRTGITVTPNAAQAPGLASGYYNADFIKGSGPNNGGICISCHYQERTKDTVRRRVEQPAAQQTTVTPVISFDSYTGSAHQYAVPSTMMGDGSTFYGNCSKCHNTKFNESTTFQGYTARWQFGNHNGGIRRLQGELDSSAGETAEEQICIRCHSKTTDSDPGGGPPKPTAGKDWYGYAGMSAAAEDITTALLTSYRPANPTTSTTSRLYFKPAAAETPAAPKPAGHNTGDAFAGGAWVERSMSPWTPSTAYETKNVATNQIGTRYWQMGTFTSPAVSSDTPIPAGTWVINLFSRESSFYQNARIRYRIYTWNAGGFDQEIVSTRTFTSELPVNSAPGLVRTIGISVPAVTLHANDKIVVDLTIQTTSLRTGPYTASFYFGKNAPSNLTLPVAVPFAYADPGQAGNGHNVNLYNGVHKPSPTDETRQYITDNKHVECADCHNVHAARSGLHGEALVSDANLYFKTAAATSPKPNAFITNSVSYAGTTTYATLNGAMSMSPGAGSSADSTAQSLPFGAATNRYYRFGQFVSPPFARSATFSTSDTFTLYVRGAQSSTSLNPFLRYAVYRFNASDSSTTVLRAPATIANEFGNNVANTVYTNTVTFNPGSTLTFLPGDKLVVEIETFETSGTDFATMTMYWGNGATDSRLVLPFPVPFKASVPGAFAGVLRGATGVGVTTWGANWAGVTTYNPATTTAPLITATAEWQICFKCHSGANANVTMWGATPPSAKAWTDLGLEFNPKNKSFHPVVAALNSAGSGSSVLPQSMAGGWSHGTTMTCSDCHAGDSPAAKGPHGSSVKWLLTGANKAWPYKGAANNGGTAGTFWTVDTKTDNQGTNDGLFCLNCHAVNNNAHNAKAAHQVIPCVGCHIRVPHGGKVSRLINTNSAGRVPRYSPNGQNGGTIYINKFIKQSGGDYSKSDCYSTNGSCGDHSSNIAGEAW